MGTIEDKTAVVVVAPYRSVSRNPVCFKALNLSYRIVIPTERCRYFGVLKHCSEKRSMPGLRSQFTKLAPTSLNIKSRNTPDFSKIGSVNQPCLTYMTRNVDNCFVVGNYPLRLSHSPGS